MENNRQFSSSSKSIQLCAALYSPAGAGAQKCDFHFVSPLRSSADAGLESQHFCVSDNKWCRLQWASHGAVVASHVPVLEILCVMSTGRHFQA